MEIVASISPIGRKSKNENTPIITIKNLIITPIRREIILVTRLLSFVERPGFLSTKAVFLYGAKKVVRIVVGVLVGVAVTIVGVAVGVEVFGVLVGVGVFVGLVGVLVGVAVLVGVLVGVAVFVGVAVGVGVSVIHADPDTGVPLQGSGTSVGVLGTFVPIGVGSGRSALAPLVGPSIIEPSIMASATTLIRARDILRILVPARGTPPHGALVRDKTRKAADLKNLLRP